MLFITLGRSRVFTDRSVSALRLSEPARPGPISKMHEEVSELSGIWLPCTSLHILALIYLRYLLGLKHAIDRTPFPALFSLPERSNGTVEYKYIHHHLGMTTPLTHLPFKPQAHILRAPD